MAMATVFTSISVSLESKMKQAANSPRWRRKVMWSFCDLTRSLPFFFLFFLCFLLPACFSFSFLLGFIFDISPAKDMKFESAGFKLTLEMVELMGSDGSTESPLVIWFQELVIRGFLAVREHRAEILAIVEPMLASTLVCFKPWSLQGLRSRFFPTLDERGAAEQMHAIVQDAWNKWTTNVYDLIQAKQQGVFYFKGISAQDPEKRIKAEADA